MSSNNHIGGPMRTKTGGEKQAGMFQILNGMFVAYNQLVHIPLVVD
jgi:hypothetical protein